MPSPFLRTLICIPLLTFGASAMAAVDILGMWSFDKPEVSEQRFRDALKSAAGDDALILQTQIARTYGLRRQFDQARATLAGIAAPVEKAGAEARTRYYLELGRTHVSATHKPAEITDEARRRAKDAYLKAFEIAREGKLDYLAIDALHMMPFVETDKASALKWNQQALEVLVASTQADARKWEGSLRNNTGYALYQLGRYDEALVLFRSNVPLATREGNAEKLRIAWWMVAWTLRALKQNDEALAIQLRLEQECDAAGAPDPYVFEELVELYKEKSDTAKVAHYAARLQSTKRAVAK
jgi:tetratricopeptide (TPR) repeat protein